MENDIAYKAEKTDGKRRRRIEIKHIGIGAFFVPN